MTAAAERSRPVSGIAWAAAAWAAVFGAGSVYLAAGGTTGLGLVAQSIRDDVLRREPGMVAALWTYGAVKLVVATVPLVATRLPARRRRWLGLAQRAVGVAFALWGGAYAVVGGLVVAQVRSAPDGWGPNAALWYLTLWGPVWMLGGALFFAAGRPPVPATPTGRPRRSPMRPVLRTVPDAGPGRALPPGQRAVPLRRFGLVRYAGWRPPEPLPAVLVVRGAVQFPARIDLADLAALLPRRDQRSDLHCAATWSTPDLLWSGFPFEALHELLIERVRPDPDARWVDCQGLDGYRSCLALDDLLGHRVLLADRLGGAPLTAAHGAPLRLVAPAQYGYKSVKHLAVLEFRHGYGAGSGRWLEHPRARVDREERGTRLPAWAYRPLGWLLVPVVRRAYRRAESRR